MLGRGSARRLVKPNVPTSFERSSNPHEAMRENSRWTTQQYCGASCTRSCRCAKHPSPAFHVPRRLTCVRPPFSVIRRPHAHSFPLAARFLMFKTYFLAWWIAVGLCTMPCQTESMICVGVGFLDSQLTRALVASYSIFRRHTHGEDHRSVSRYTPAPGIELKVRGPSS